MYPEYIRQIYESRKEGKRVTREKGVKEEEE